MAAMRDEFWNVVYEAAKKDRNIVILSADFSAPSLDKFRLNLPQQYIFMGISEQNMLLVAAGLALEGKKVFCYAIAPFITMRCFEQTRLYAAGMNLPINLVGVGAGIAYDNSGYTHHAVEDIALLRTLPHMNIYQPCDNVTTRQIAAAVLEEDAPSYVRLDRYDLENINDKQVISKGGLRIIDPVQSITILSSGSTMRVALNAKEELARKGITVGVIDAYRFPIEKEWFSNQMRRVKKLITLEEHVLPGGIGSYILELISDLEMDIKVKRFGFDFFEGYTKEYGGRDIVYQQQKMDSESICSAVVKWGE